MEQPSAARHLMASYDTVEQAERAVDLLARKGFDESKVGMIAGAGTDFGAEGGRLSGQGVSVEEAPVEETAQEAGTTKARATRGGFGGVLVGGLVGAVLGFLVGTLVFGWPPDGRVVAAAVGAAGAGAVVGGLAAGFQRFREASARDALQTGAILVGYHTDDEAEIEPVAAALRSSQVKKLDVFDRGWELLHSLPTTTASLAKDAPVIHEGQDVEGHSTSPQPVGNRSLEAEGGTAGSQSARSTRPSSGGA